MTRRRNPPASCAYPDCVQPPRSRAGASTGRLPAYCEVHAGAGEEQRRWRERSSPANVYDRTAGVARGATLHLRRLRAYELQFERVQRVLEDLDQALVFADGLAVRARRDDPVATAEAMQDVLRQRLRLDDALEPLARALIARGRSAGEGGAIVRMPRTPGVLQLGGSRVPLRGDVSGADKEPPTGA